MSADEYTPTRDEVRDAYLRGTRTPPYSVNDTISRAEFDRFLAAHDAEVARAAKAEGKAEAWDEGYAEGVADQSCWDGWRYSTPGRPVENPYRKVATDE